MSDDLDVRDVPAPWRELEVHRVLGSTNDRAKEIARPYVVVAAEHQTTGRGRLARAWQTPAGVALTFSVTVPLAGVTVPGWLPLLTGLAVARAVDDVAAQAGPGGGSGAARATLKWPNDVLLGGGKLCGVLCELVPAGDTPLVVIGMGINVHQDRDELPVPTATSLALAGIRTTRERVLAAVLTRLPEVLALPGPAGRAAYLDRCATIGGDVRVHLPGGEVVTGRAVGVEDDGRIVVESHDATRSFAAGDVHHLRPGLA